MLVMAGRKLQTYSLNILMSGKNTALSTLLADSTACEK